MKVNIGEEMQIQIGDKVVCVENAFDHWKGYNFIVPIKDEIYTVREVKYFNEVHYKGIAIKLVEIRNKVFRFPNMVDEVSWRIKYFIPLHEYLTEETLKSIDISPLLRRLQPSANPSHKTL